MNLEEYRTAFAATSLILILIAFAPTLMLIFHVPSGSESFSELWLLGPEHRAENYPFNISINALNSVYVGLRNQLGEPAYYILYVKFCNSTQPEPTRESASNLTALYEYRIILEDEETWETLFTFRVDSASFTQNNCTVESILLNNKYLNISRTSTWDNEQNGFYYRLLFELWVYNTSQRIMQYHNRFVRLWLNITRS